MVTLQGINISHQKGTFEDNFPFPQVGYVNFLEGKFPSLHDGWVAIFTLIQMYTSKVFSGIT